MAKIPFSKLGVKADNEVALLSWGEYEIEVKKYLPMSEKAEMISRVINLSADDNGYYNPLQIKVFLTLETIYAYTNISFTEKQKENVLKLYDMVISSGLFSDIVSLIPEEEWKDLQNTVWDTISNIYEYKNSVMGVLDALKTDYSGLNFDAAELRDNLGNPENLGMLKDILDKLG
jgi:hypothetical protein